MASPRGTADTGYSEFAHGGSYLSQSSRNLMLNPKSVNFVELFSYTGQRKRISLEDAK
ncbi:hypothetical protein SAMN05421636_11076 [Pricia antarctica]|uniref:Uncharacterized protein n=1 Tax=Pricia antarctica TaxID=641691 RepID=A0A1G7HWU1_9FLAO|nr:hypothetical protein SAMN05421636_11076 [Pricia antarctica]